MTMKAVCVHIHVSDNREAMSDAENSWLPIDALLRDDVIDDRKYLCDEIGYFASMFT